MKILLLSGEQSGLIYADAIRRRIEEVRRSVGEPLEIRTYADYGFKTADLAVIGFWPVLKRLGYFLGVRRTMQRAIDEWRPDVVCTIDYPGMNLRLAAYAKKRGVRAVHVVCPQVWAWRSGRIPRIEASLDSLLCFLPFEPKLFKPGFAEFVGHPLVEAFKSLPRKAGGPGGDARRLVALLPGSRIGEIEQMLPTMLDAMRELECARAVIPAANGGARAAIERVMSRDPRPWIHSGSVVIKDGGARELLLEADAAVVASGTATLEAALAGCPTVLVYRVQPFVAWVARRVIKGVRHLGLVNIIWDFMNPGADGECPMPELLQEDFNAAKIVATIRPWLVDQREHGRARRRLADAVALLSTGTGAIDRIAEVVCTPR